MLLFFSLDETSHKVPLKRPKKCKTSQDSKPFAIPENHKADVKAEDDKEDIIRNIRLRTSPAQLAVVMTSLNHKQRQFVKDIGFGSLLGFSIDSLPGKLVYYVVDSFDSKEMVIKTSRGDIKCDRQAVHDVFGVPMGPTNIYDLEESSNNDLENEWLGQWNIGKKVRPANIASMFNNDYEISEMFKINILMLFVSTMVESDSNGYIKLDLLKRLPKNSDLRSFDWCGFLLKSLASSKDNWNRDFPDKNPYSGPATFLSVS